MNKKRRFILIIAFVLAAGLVCCTALAASVTIEPHKYTPIAPAKTTQEDTADVTGSAEDTSDEAREDRSINMCSDPLHQSEPVCSLISWNVKGGGEWSAKTNAVVKDVKLTTLERTKHLKENDLQEYIIKKAKAQFRNAETNALLNNLHVVSVSNLDVIKRLGISAGSMSVTVDLGISPQEGGKAEAYIQTRIHLVYESEKTKNDYDDDDDDDDYYGNDIDNTPNYNSAAALAKKREEERKAKEKAAKERLKKLTAEITPKEREKDTDVAMAADEPKPVSEGPSTEGILLIMAAAAAAAVFGHFIRSDLRVMRWYKQKKALHRQK